MTNNINRAISLTSYLVSLPRARSLVLGIFVLGLIFGLILNVSSFSPSSAFVFKCISDGTLLLAAPALLTSFLVKLLMRQTPYRRIVATAFAGEIVYGIAYLISYFTFKISPFWAQLVLLFGASLVFVLWYVIARFVFLLKYRSLLFSILQLLLYLAFLFGNETFWITRGTSFVFSAATFYLSSFVLLGSLIFFFFIINAPMKKNLGVKSTDAISYFFSQWLYHNRDMEKAFAQVGEKVRTFVSVMAFKRKSDTVLFITPYVHFGPFGNLGGSEFSYLIAQEVDKKYASKSFVFHGTVTHDLNPVSASQITPILDSIDSILKSATYKSPKSFFTNGTHAECRAHNLHIDEHSFVSLTRSPHTTEDINFGLGLSMLYAAEKYVKNAMIVDQHNSETGEITSFEPGSVVGFNYLSAIESSFAPSELAPSTLRIGVSTTAIVSDIIGKGGIKVCILSSNVPYILILIDCNGITPQFHESIVREVKSMSPGSEVGVYTTDTHQLNMVRGVLNPLKEESAVLEAIKVSVSRASDDLSSCEFFADRRWVDIEVIGAKQSIELISTVNSIVAMSKIILPLLILGGLLLLVALISALDLRI